LIWRPILRQVATLEEIETHYTLADLLDVNEALDIQDEIDDYNRPKE